MGKNENLIGFLFLFLHTGEASKSCIVGKMLVVILHSGKVLSKTFIAGKDENLVRFLFLFLHNGEISKSCIVGKMLVLILHSGEVLSKPSLWGRTKT